MQSAQFDDIARSLGESTRHSFVGKALRGFSARFARDSATTHAAPDTTARSAAVAAPASRPTICDSPDTAGLQSRTPGELIASEEITPTDDATFPRGARAWRVLYVSTGRDNSERTLVCGVVVAPASAERIFVQLVAGANTGRVVAWCHGTLGMVRRCQPSAQPASEIWGPTPYGINVLSWGSEASNDQHLGTPEDGILAGIIDAGWVLAATDYDVGLGGSNRLQPYVIGKIEAANTIDSVRAAHQLLARAYDDYALHAYDVVTWGHSQGGHAALWTGQLLDAYTAATAAAGGPTLALAGVALEAPGGNFIVQPDEQPDSAPGFGDLDWLANGRLALTGVPAPIPVAPFFFSYLFGAWAQHSRDGAPEPSQQPAYPDLGPLDITALVLPDALETVAAVDQICWTDGEQLVALTTPYAAEPFLPSAISGGEVVDGFQHGGIDAICAGNPPDELATWCAWFRYNLPGPLGKHPLPKLPRRGKQLAPVLIVHGANDAVVHCVAPQDAAGMVPSARDCMSAALYDALQAEYCPHGASNGYLRLQVWQPQAGVTAANHSDITALAATSSVTEPKFLGSPLHQFFVAAFTGTLEPGCAAVAVNLSDST